jgi:hypothetical protein
MHGPASFERYGPWGAVLLWVRLPERIVHHRRSLLVSGHGGDGSRKRLTALNWSSDRELPFVT